MKNILVITIIVALALVLFLAFRKNYFYGLIAFILALFGAIIGSSGKVRDKEEKVKPVISDLKEKEKEIKEQREAHDKEVKEIDEADYSDMSIDDLIAHANERERKRGADKGK